MAAVSRRARNGSPRLVVFPNTLRNGITLSLAIACSNRGAPVKKKKYTIITLQSVRKEGNVLFNDALNTFSELIELFLISTSSPQLVKQRYGMCYPVCGMMHIKEPLLLIRTSPCSCGSRFPLFLFEWFFTIIMCEAI